MSITPSQKRFLRAEAHHLKPVVALGQNGLTQAVIAEIGVALDAHELIKVRVSGEDRDDRYETISEISRQTGAHVIQSIGHVAVFFRRNTKKPRIALPG